MEHHELVQQSGSGKWNYELIMLWLKDDSVSYIDINENNILIGLLIIMTYVDIKTLQ